MTSLALSGCISIEEAPITVLKVPIITNTVCDDKKCMHEGVCDVRTITDKKTLSSIRHHVGHLSECNGVWGLTSKEFGELRIFLKGL